MLSAKHSLTLPCIIMISIVEFRYMGRYYLSDSLNVYAEAVRYAMIHNRINAICNCTYSNRFGLEYKW